MAQDTVAKVEHANLADALAAFQAEIPTVKKGNQAKIPGKEGKSGYAYSYADLTDVTEAALPLLGRHGLAWTTKPTIVLGDGVSFVLEYQLRHGPSGEAIEGMYPLPDPMRTAPQALGSAITYARRYCLVAVTGVAPGGDDDDAQAAQPHAAASRREPQRRPQQEPADPPKPSRDWAAMAYAAASRDELKAVYEAADRAQQLGLKLDDGRFVGAALKQIRDERFPQPPAAPVETPSESSSPVDEGQPMIFEAGEGTPAWGGDRG